MKIPIRCKNPNIYAAKRQSAAFRLAEKRCFNKKDISSVYSCRRTNALMIQLENVNIITPLMPGEKTH